MKSLDRRRLLTSGAAAAVLAASGVGAVAAPNRGGALRLGVSGGDARDRWTAPRPFGTFMQVAGVGCAFETLTELAPDGMLRGELATSWEPLDGGRSWVFELRRGARFHDGRPMGSDDVVLSFRRHLKLAGSSPAVRLPNVTQIRKSGAAHVRFDLSSRDVDFPLRLADPHLIVHPAEGWRDALARGVGTGLYRLERFEAGSGFTAERVTDHWKGASGGWFDRVAAMSLPDRANRIAALITGRVDAIDDPGENAVDMLKSSGWLLPNSGASGGSWAASARLAHGTDVGSAFTLDNGRIAERWWFA